MSHAPRYSDHDLEPLRAALLALAAGEKFRAPSAAAGHDLADHGILSQIWSLVDAVATELATLNTEVARRAEQVRDIATVTTAVARGDLTRKVTVDVQGEMLQLKQTVNTMVDQLSAFADEVTRVAREVGTEGRPGGQADVRGVCGVWKDLTDSVNGLQQLAISSQYKSEFLANMSHELRTPLNSLLVLARLLSENLDGNLTVEQVEFARTIHDAGADLLQLINDILDLSKVEAGKMDVHLAPITVEELLDYLDATIRPTATQQGLAFAVLVDPGVPPVIYADGQRLQQILRNLLSNAVKFTHRGGVLLRVAPAAAGTRFTGPLRDATTVLAFAVTDTGIGIAEEKLEQIFGAFQQADGTTSRGYGGTGLGLSISRGIARLLGGEIHATSRPGRGSTFTFYLPDRREAFEAGRGTGAGGEREEEFSLSRTNRDSAPSPAVNAVAGGTAGTTGPFGTSGTGGAGGGTGGITEPPAAGGSSPGFFAAAPAPPDGDPLSGAKILIVDDDVRNVFALTSVFELYGAVVRHAENGRAGIELLDSEPDVALVLMDVMMPELDGYATTAAIRRRREFAGLPVVMVTAKAMKGDRTKAIASGASEYVAKPVDIEQLIGLMRGLLSGTASVLGGS